MWSYIFFDIVNLVPMTTLITLQKLCMHKVREIEPFNFCLIAKTRAKA